jgi:hypothetical protein
MVQAAFVARAILTKRVFQDTFTRSDPTSWGTPWTATFISTPGVLSVDGSVGRLTADEFADVIPNDVDPIVSGQILFDFHTPTDPDDGDLYFFIRWGEPYYTYVEVFWSDTNEMTLWITDDELNAAEPFVTTPDTWYRVRAVNGGAIGAQFGAKVWEVGDPEPADWLVYKDHPDDLNEYFDGYFVEVASPGAELLGFDNFEIWDQGTPVTNVTQATFTANAAKKRFDISGSATANAVFGDRYFKADAWILGNRLRHHREHDHYGEIPDTSVIINGAIGPYPDGTDVHTVLLGLYDRQAALEAGTLRTRNFNADAYLQPNFKGDAVIKRTIADTFTLDAYFGRSGSFTADSFLFKLATATIPANAFLIQSTNGTWTYSNVTPAPDGVITVFSINTGYVQGSLTVYLNGVPTTAFTELDDNTGTFEMDSPPAPGTVILVHYLACSG